MIQGLPYLTLGAAGKITIEVKKRIEAYKDAQAMGQNINQEQQFNNSVYNKAIISASRSLGYILLILLITGVTFVLSHLPESWNPAQIFLMKDTIMFFILHILIPVSYYIHNDDLRKFVKDFLIEYLNNVIE